MKEQFVGVQCYDVLHLAVNVPRSALHSSAHHRQPAQHSQHNTIQHSWATLVHLHTRHSNNNHSSDSTTQNSTWQNSTPIIHRQVHVGTHCHGTNQSQIHFATGGVEVNPPQHSLQLVGSESISCKTVLQKGPLFIQKGKFVIQFMDSELTGCKTVSQHIDPDPAGCKMDLGLIGSMARSSHKLSSFVYTHPARLHLPTRIHESSHSRGLLEM